MNKTTSHYQPDDYDEHLCLKLPLGFWLSVLFLLRPFVVFLASVSNSADRFGMLNTIYPDHRGAMSHAAAAIPAFALLLIYTRRAPTAGELLRRLWRHGRALLATSALLNLAFLGAAPIVLQQKMTPIIGLQWVLSFIVLYYLFRSQRIADCFAEFPPPPK